MKGFGGDMADVECTGKSGTVQGERGLSTVNRARSLQSRMSSVLAAALMLTIGLGMLSWYYSNAMTRQKRARERAQSVSVSSAQGEMPLPTLSYVPAPESLSTPQAAPVQPQSEALIASASRGSSQGGEYAAAPTKTPAQLAFERQLSGLVFSGIPAKATAGGTDPPPTASMTVDGGADGGLQGLLRTRTTPAARAQLLPTQRLLLAKGAFIDCTLETAIDSTLPGMTTCITATDTFSVDGKVVLLERGTKLVGETRGQVQQGSARIFVVWTEARTPSGVIVPLDSPGADELGRSGMSGTVSRHFLDRFGAAILISMIDGAVQAAVQSPSHSGGTIVYNPQASQDVLTDVLKSTINIPPSVVKHQGDRIQVLVARDLDFRSVYELQSSE
jgi:type IV secretion system protein VirB10